MKLSPPGDDEVPVPDVVDELPPRDQFCDLVLTGGIASGVVYPWAIVEIARKFWFKSVGGTSVGALAAALAAAAEYGRRHGSVQSFEVLRRLPAALGEPVEGYSSRMLSLFQVKPQGRRLMRLWGRLGRGQRAPQVDQTEPCPELAVPLWRGLVELLWAYRWPVLLGAGLGLLVTGRGSGSVLAKIIMALLGAVMGLVVALARDVRHGVIRNHLGLCRGGTEEGPDSQGQRRPGICEWLHEGIQQGAGLKRHHRPLTFRDLWSAPVAPGHQPIAYKDGDSAGRRSINLQMITTNVTLGRPCRLPLEDQTSRLFFKPAELEAYFPPGILKALVVASKPYQPANEFDPITIEHAEEFRELPGADMPLVVAARLSMSFPLLFAAVPLWAIDYQAARDQRQLRRCLFADGGLCSNFPIHLFDAAIPRWPTFGLWLDKFDAGTPLPKESEEAAVSLPKGQGHESSDNWTRFDPQAIDPASSAAQQGQVREALGWKFLWRYFNGLLTTALDWQDRSTSRLPHVRERVAKIWLRAGEGGFHIAMSKKQILAMAHRYGTRAGELFVERYSGQEGAVAKAWSDHRWIRLNLLVKVMKERFEGLRAAAAFSARTVPLREAVARTQARGEGPVGGTMDARLSESQAKSLLSILDELDELERALAEVELQDLQLLPTPELRMRAPL